MGHRSCGPQPGRTDFNCILSFPLSETWVQSIKLTELAKTISIETERAKYHSSFVFLEVKNGIKCTFTHCVCESGVLCLAWPVLAI